MSDQERYIVEALQKAVIAAVAASDDDTLAIRMLGRTLDVPSNGKWLEVVHIPNNSNPTWGDEQVYEGMFRLILHWPVDDQGVYDAMYLMRTINAYFTKGSKHSDSGDNVEVTITRQPMFMGLIEEAPEMLFPYGIQYRCYVT